MTLDPATSGRWYRARFVAVVFFPGAVLMALEIVSSRLLAPRFGNSVYVWGSIIGVFLAAMSVGYLVGGRVADRSPRLEVLGALLLAAAACQWATGIVGRWLVEVIGSWTSGRPAGTLLAVVALFAPATLFLATVAPFAIRIAHRDPDRLGGLAGRIYALSTVGSLAGTMAATFVLIPRFALDDILALLIASSAAVAALASGIRRPLLLGLCTLAGVAPWLPAVRPAPQREVLAERITPYQTLIVRQRGDLRTLESDGTRHGALNVVSGEPALTYLPGVLSAWLFRPDTRSVAILGLGSGGIGAFLRARLPGLEITYVEIDPAVPPLAERWFGFRVGEGLSLVVDDGRRFLSRSSQRFDLVYCDTYVGLSVPFHLATVEFFREAAGRLNPGGTLAVNLAAELQHPFTLAILRTMHRVFPQVEVFRIEGSANILLLGLSEVAPVSEAALIEAGRGLDQKFGIEPRFEDVARGRLEVSTDLSEVPVLTDAYAPVDALLNFAEPVPRLDLGQRGSRAQGGGDG